MLRCCITSCLLMIFGIAFASAADPAPPPVKPKAKITPGKPIVPTGTGEMRRIWGELISLDPATRTGKFRNMGDDAVFEFVVMPYAELLHHAAQGDLQDYIPGERAIFRLHEDEQGVWKYLTYIQDEMNFFKNHGEWYFIDEIDRQTGRLKCHQAKEDESFIREAEVYVDVDAKTQFWRGGKPVSFEDLKVKDKFQTKAHGVGQGQARTAWHVFLDSESLEKFAAEQRAVHVERMKANGFPGYVDAVSVNSSGGNTVELTLFGWARDYNKHIKPGLEVKLAPVGTDLNPTAEPIAAKITAAKAMGHNTKLTLETAQALPKDVAPPNVLRVWIPQILEAATK